MAKFFQKILTMPGRQFRLVGGFLVAPFLLFAAITGATFNTAALLVATLFLIWQAPKLRSKAMDLPQAQALMVTAFMVFGLGMMTFSTLTLSWFGVQKVLLFFTIPAFGFKKQSMAKMKKFGQMPPMPIVADLTKLPVAVEKKEKDPNRPKTNTYRKYLARQAKIKGKKK